MNLVEYLILKIGRVGNRKDTDDGGTRVTWKPDRHFQGRTVAQQCAKPRRDYALTSAPSMCGPASVHDVLAYADLRILIISVANVSESRMSL